MKRFVGILVLLAAVVLLSGQRRAGSLGGSIDLLITGGTVVTMDGERRIFDNGFVAIRGERIIAVGDAARLKAKGYQARQTIDARGKLVLPGLVNAHTHIPMSLFRGIADDLNLQDWLTKYIFPAEAKNVTREFVVAGTQLGLAEMIRGGITTYADMYYFEDAIAEETKRAGVRGVLGETVIDFPVPDNKTWAEAMAYSEKFLQRWKGDSLITAAIAPSLPDSNVDLYMGVGGSPEGVLTAAALRTLGGDIQLRMWIRDDAERRSLAHVPEAKNLKHIYRADELCAGPSVIFCVTGISDNPVTRGVQFQGRKAITHTLLMRARSRSVRYIKAYHDLDHKTIYLRSKHKESLV